MKILIVDDEILALQRLETMLKKIGCYEIVATNDGKEAIELLRDIYFDILITDIEMPDLNGIDLAKSIAEISPDTYIIFQTAYNEYALKAFEVGAIDYLLKPYSSEELDKSILRASKFLAKEEKKRVLSRNGDEFYLLRFEEIIYIKAELSEVMIRTKDNFSYYSKQISQVETLLKPFNFFRIHRSYIINLDKVKSMESSQQSRVKFYFSDIPEAIESSREGAKIFRERFKES
jgi:two-component system LytT family response regulator